MEVPPELKKDNKREKKREERLNDGQAMHGARKHEWRTQAPWEKRGLGNQVSNKESQNLRHPAV